MRGPAVEAVYATGDHIVPSIETVCDGDPFSFGMMSGLGIGVSKTDFYSVERSLWTWMELNGCPSKASSRREIDTEEDDTRVVIETFGPGREGAEVVLVTIEGGGHSWPGRAARLRGLGRSTRDVSANDLMWGFFTRHPMP